MKISYYQWMILESDIKKQSARDETWKQYGPEITKISSNFMNRNDMRHYARAEVEKDENNPIKQSLRSYNRVVEKAKKQMTMLCRDLAGSWHRDGVPDHVVRGHIESAIQRAIPHPKYERLMMKWIATRQVRQLEDIDAAGSDLARYHELAQKRILDPSLEISMYANHTNFHNMTRAQLSAVANARVYRDKQEEALLKTASEGKDWSTVIDHPEYQVHQIHTFLGARAKARCPTGQKALWCTAISHDQHFKTYNKRGPLFVVHPKKAAYDGEQYQIHFETDNYMDELDNPVSTQQLDQRFPNIIGDIKGARKI